MQVEWKTEKRKLSELHPSSYNPRKFNDKNKEYLTASLTKFNLAEPIIINIDNTIIGGHFRYKILTEKYGKNGYEVDVRVPTRTLSITEEKELNLRLNRNLGDWDFDLLGKIDLSMLKDVGFDSTEIDKATIDLPGEDDDLVPDAPKKAISKLGEVYTLGRHRLMCGDSTKKEDVERLMDGKKMSALFTDPPYNVGVKYGKDTNDAKSFDDFVKWCKSWNEFCPKKKILTVGIQRLVWWDSILGDPQWILAWIKMNGQGNTKLGGTNKWDAVLLYEVELDGGIDVVEISNDYSESIKSKGEHPTAKPVALFTYLIKRFSKNNDFVLDPFGGSGSTLIACEKTHRVCYMMEIDPLYCDVIRKRYEIFTTAN